MSERFNDWLDPDNQPEPERPRPPVNGNIPDGYAEKALHYEIQRVADAEEGVRNDTLNEAAFNLGTLVGAGHLTQPDVEGALTDAGVSAGLTLTETLKTIRSGLTEGVSRPRHVPERPALPTLTVLPDTAHELWDERPILAHLRDFARARRASPWAVLGVTLARVVTQTPPFVVLPELVGGVASLNLFVGLVGKPGAGKGAAEAASADALAVGYVETASVGSGEGLAHMYAKRTKGGDIDRHTHRVLFTVAEVDTLGALGQRSGATLMPELRKAWSGERLGFSYADPNKRLPVEAHTYRLAIVGGVQPGRGRVLLDDSDAGTPQRFLWLPATDPEAPREPPGTPLSREWKLPDLPKADTSGRVTVPVCASARELIDTQRWLRLRGEGDALDGHALLARLKLAAALALLDGRVEVTEDDWRLSQTLMDVSDATRAGVQAELAKITTEQNRARGELEADRQILVTERVDEAAVKRVCAALMRSLAGGPIGQSKLRKDLASRDRGYFKTALSRLVDAGQVEVTETERGHVVRKA